MRVVAQRVKHASVTVDGKTVGKIGQGLLLLVSAGADDNEKDLDWMSNKVLKLRVFSDSEDKMNLSVLDIKGEILAVSQFTLHGDARKGLRPSFTKAMHPDKAEPYFDKFLKSLNNALPNDVQTGVFGAMMDVELLNDGPVTILLDSKKTF